MGSITVYGMTITLRSESDGSIRAHTVRYLSDSPDEAARAAARHVRFLTSGSDIFPLPDDHSMKAHLVDCRIFCEFLGEVSEGGHLGTLTLVPFIEYSPSAARYVPRGRYFRSKSAFQLAAPGSFDDFVEAFVANEVIDGSLEIAMSVLQSALA